MKKNIAFALLLLICSGVIQAQVSPPLWADIVAFKKEDSLQKPPVHPILFIGSSSFRKWENLSSSFPGYPIINRGFGGSTLVDVIRYTYDIILPYQPKQVVIYCGENDLGNSDSASAPEVVKRVKTLFWMIRTNLPDATISYVSIKPSPLRSNIQDRVRSANKDIQAFFKTQKNATFIDIYNVMLDAKGNMREELFIEDRLHMKPEGYEIWKRIISPFLVK